MDVWHLPLRTSCEQAHYVEHLDTPGARGYWEHICATTVSNKGADYLYQRE